MLKWYDNSTPDKASSTSRSVTPKSILCGVFVYPCNVDVMHFDSLGQEGLSHDETLGTKDLDLPFGLNILAQVSDEFEGIVSDHATFQNWVDGESRNEHDVVLVRLEIVIVKIDEHIDNDDDPMEAQYDAESSENKGNKNDEDVMVDEENEVYEVEVDVHLFGNNLNNHDFTTIGVSSQVHEQVMLRVDAYVLEGNYFYSNSGCEGYGSCGRRCEINKLKKSFMQ
nr:hypothetical protein [Tanacetum cinerariifolium]